MSELSSQAGLYREALIVYLDILGFSDLINQSDSNPEIAAEILQALRNMQAQLYLDEQPFRTPDSVEKASFNTLNFSDLTIRATYLDGDLSWAEALEHELHDLTVQQTELVGDGILIRGAITTGKLYVDKGHVFGPALVRGYCLERDVAVFPRVLISDELITRAFEAEVYGYSRQGDDGVWFLDYLYGYFMTDLFGEGRGKYSYAEIIRRHKEVAEQRLEQMLNKPERVKQKAIWLALYHNNVIARARDYLMRRNSEFPKPEFKRGLDALQRVQINPRLIQGLPMPAEEPNEEPDEEQE